MKNSLTSVFVLFILGASAQQDIHLNRVTVYGGATNYLGRIGCGTVGGGPWRPVATSAVGICSGELNRTTKTPVHQKIGQKRRPGSSSSTI